MESRKVLLLTIVLFVCLSFEADLLQAATQRYYCVFDPDISTLRVVGGIAGCMCTTEVYGDFGLIVDWNAGTALFDEVDVPVSCCVIDLGSDLAGREGTVLNSNLIYFPYYEDGLYVSGISTGFAHLYGGDDCIPFIMYDCLEVQLNAYATAIVIPETCNYILLGNLNGDCKVDHADFAELASGWQISYDINTLAEMAVSWLADCNLYPEDPSCIPIY